MLISLSTMPAGKDFLKYVKEVEQYADFMHLDICDGEYNSSMCFLPEYAKEINSNSTIFLDCHLMTKNPIKFAKQYIEAGVNLVTCQIESFENGKQIDEFVDYVHKNNALVGLAVEPKTDIKRVLPYLSKIDNVLVMSVQTGLSGQMFQPIVLSKIEYLAKLKASFGYHYKIEVDGGINEKIIRDIKNAGAEIAVSGSFVYDAKDRQSAVGYLRKI